jgi:four helix bundle protein
MSDFKDLKTWQKAHKMALETHRVACKIRGSGHSGVRKQMIDAALSVPTNIEESSGTDHPSRRIRYLAWPLILHGVGDHLLTAAEMKLITSPEAEMLTAKLVEIEKMLYGLIRSLNKRDGLDKSPS